MVDTATKAQAAAELDLSPTLDELDGAAGLLAALDALVGGDGIVVAIGALVREWNADDEQHRELVARAIASEPDMERLEHLLGLSRVTFQHPDVAQRVLAVLCGRVGDRGDDYAAGVAAACLAEAVRLVVTTSAVPYELFQQLGTISAGEPSHFTILAIRHMPVLYAYKPSEDLSTVLRLRLEALAKDEQVTADAHHALGAIALARSLAASSLDDVLLHMQDARERFARAFQLDAARADSDLFLAVTEAVLGIVEQRPAEVIEQLASKIRSLGLERQAWRAQDALAWAGDTYASDRAWWLLARRLPVIAHASTSSLTKMARLISDLVGAFHAIRTVELPPNATDGLGTLLTPTIAGRFATSSNRLVLLRELVTETDDPLIAEAAATLIEMVSDPSNGGVNAAAMVEVLGDVEVAQVLADKVDGGTLLKLKEIVTKKPPEWETENAEVRRTLAEVRIALKGNVDFLTDAGTTFMQIVTSTVRYLHERMNRQLSSPGMAFLADPNAKEAPLQKDYRECMAIHGGMSGVIDDEVPHQATGRVDVRFADGPRKFVTEVKQMADPFAGNAIDSHLNQTGAYQISEPKLGILLILDTSPKKSLETRSLRASVFVRAKPKTQADDHDRHIVVVVVPGNRTHKPSEANQ